MRLWAVVGACGLLFVGCSQDAELNSEVRPPAGPTESEVAIDEFDGDCGAGEIFGIGEANWEWWGENWNTNSYELEPANSESVEFEGVAAWAVTAVFYDTELVSYYACNQGDIYLIEADAQFLNQDCAYQTTAGSLVYQPPLQMWSGAEIARRGSWRTAGTSLSATTLFEPGCEGVIVSEDTYTAPYDVLWTWTGEATAEFGDSGPLTATSLRLTDATAGADSASTFDIMVAAGHPVLSGSGATPIPEGAYPARFEIAASSTF
jgi:hypothetical protein